MRVKGASVVQGSLLNRQGEVIARLRTSEANITLFAAAPDLLAALVELVECKRIKDADGKTAEYEQRQPLAWETARAVIARAEGVRP